MSVADPFRIHGLACARRRIRDPRRNGPVITARVHPAAWQAALRLASGDRSRLRVQGPGSVLVINQGQARDPIERRAGLGSYRPPDSPRQPGPKPTGRHR
ncbi:MAG TPA: hypothetical protein VME19_17675 [Streptosporangiaceae bacterium]|nr:hypothetical protein [Streptosporangiaceae bacterium]